MLSRWFTHFATKAAAATGHWVAFVASVLLVIGWAASGPFFGFSETWQLIINTTTTVITYLMVFLIQHTQNRDQYAIQRKLDELIAAIEGANNELIGIEKKEGSCE